MFNLHDTYKKKFYGKFFRHLDIKHLLIFTRSACDSTLCYIIIYTLFYKNSIYKNQEPQIAKKLRIS